MRCLFCHRRVGLLRRVIDRQFCSSDHRRRYRTTSARFLRDRGEIVGDLDDYFIVNPNLEKKPPKPSPIGASVAAVIGLVLGLMLWLLPSTAVPTGPKLRYTLSQNPVSQTVRAIIPENPKINLRQDFTIGPGDWIGGSTNAGYEPGTLRPDRLRLWKPSLALRDYQLEFQGSIERRAVGWAFRATDLHNYYGSKLSVSEKGQRAEIERFVMVAGRSLDRVKLPIPIPIQPETSYRVRVKVKGEYFTTTVNGQMVDTWRDKRLRQGGVGFFADKGEVAAIRWVSLSEPESFFGRLFALGFILPPME